MVGDSEIVADREFVIGVHKVSLEQDETGAHRVDTHTVTGKWNITRARGTHCIVR